MRQTDLLPWEKSAGVGGVVGGGPSRHLLTRANKPERRELERKGKTRLNSPSSTTPSNEPDS